MVIWLHMYVYHIIVDAPTTVSILIYIHKE